MLTVKFRYRDFLYFLVIFIFLANLFPYIIARFLGTPRPLIYWSYFLAMLPVCISGKKRFYYYSAALFIFLFSADVTLLLLAKFNYKPLAMLNVLKLDFVDLAFVKNLFVTFVTNDIKTNLSLKSLMTGAAACALLSLPGARLKYGRIDIRGVLRSFTKIFLIFFVLWASFSIFGIIITGIISLLIFFAAVFIWFPMISDLNLRFTLTYLIASAILLYALNIFTKMYIPGFYFIDNMFSIPSDDHHKVRWDAMYTEGFRLQSVNVDSASKIIFDKIYQNKMDHDKVLLIIAESFGVFKDSSSQKVVYSALDDPEFKKYYNVSFSETVFAGNTLSAEFRELCRFRQFMTLPTEKEKILLDHCLPELLAKQGYETAGMHNAAGAFFDRINWYPLFDWDKMIFQEDITDDYGLEPVCGTSFPGICEKDVFGKVIAGFFDNSKKQFLHFMTVEGHMPVDMDRPVSAEFQKKCDNNVLLGKKDNKLLCVFSELHYNVLMYAKELAMKLKDKKIIIVIVGDHKPPIAYSKYSDKYKDNVVPSVIIESKR